MSFAASELMRDDTDKRVAAGNHGNTSEYIVNPIEEGRAPAPGRRRTKVDEPGVVLLRVGGQCPVHGGLFATFAGRCRPLCVGLNYA